MSADPPSFVDVVALARRVYPGGTGLMNGAVFGHICGTTAGRRAVKGHESIFWARAPG